MKSLAMFMKVGKYLLFPLVLVAGIAQMQQSRLQSTFNPSDESLSQQANQESQKLAAQLLLIENMPDFGFRNLVADWTFLTFLQYFGRNEHRQITGYGQSADFFDIIIDRDPYAYTPYIYLSSSISLFAGEPERSIKLQEIGLQSLSPSLPPRSYFIWRSKGIDEILFLDDYQAASRSHAMAADWAAQSPYPEAAADQHSLRRTAEFLAQNPDAVEIQVSAWAQVLSYAPDHKTRAVAVRNIEALGYEVVLLEEGDFSIRPKQPTAGNS